MPDYSKAGQQAEREHLLEVLDMIEDGSGRLEEAVHKVGKSMQELVAQESYRKVTRCYCPFHHLYKVTLLNDEIRCLLPQ